MQHSHHSYAVKLGYTAKNEHHQALYRKILSCLVPAIFLCLALSSGLVADQHSRDLVHTAPGSIGREFYLCYPPLNTRVDSVQYGMTVLSQANCTFTIIKPGTSFAREYTCKRNLPLHIDFDSSVAAVFETKGSDSVPTVSKGMGLHVISTEPITIQCTMQQRTRTESWLALSLDALGTRYVVLGASSAYTSTEGILPAVVALVATKDKQKVHVVAGGTSGIATGYSQSKSFDMVLNASDVLVFYSRNLGQQDLCGSIISSDGPLSVFSASQSAVFARHDSSASFSVEQLQAAEFWGRQHYVPRLFDSRKATQIHVVGAQPTTIYRDSLAVLTLTKDAWYPHLGNSFVDGPLAVDTVMTLWADTTMSAALLSAGLSPTDHFANATSCTILPTEQFTSTVLIQPVLFKHSSRLKQNTLGIIAPLNTDKNTISDSLMIGEYVSGRYVWTPVKTLVPAISPKNVYAQPSITDNAVHYAYLEIPYSSANSAIVRCDRPIAVYQYGYQDSTAYAQTAMSVARRIHMKIRDTVAPSVSIQNVIINGCRGTITDGPSNSTIRSNLCAVDVLWSTRLVIPMIDSITPGTTSSVRFIAQYPFDSTIIRLSLVAFDMAGNYLYFDTLVVDKLARTWIEPHITSICRSQALSVRSSFVCAGYRWSTGDTTRSTQLRFDSLGQYTVRLYQRTEFGEEFLADSMVVNVVDIPQHPIIEQRGDSLVAASTDPQAVLYVWMQNGVPIDSSTTLHSIFVFMRAGSYALRVYNQSGCSNTSNMVDVIHDEVKSDCASECLVGAHGDQITVRVVDSNVSSAGLVCSLYDLRGRLIATAGVDEQGVCVFRNLQMGVYLLDYVLGQQIILLSELP